MCTGIQEPFWIRPNQQIQYKEDANIVQMKIEIYIQIQTPATTANKIQSRMVQRIYKYCTNTNMNTHTDTKKTPQWRPADHDDDDDDDDNDGGYDNDNDDDGDMEDDDDDNGDDFLIETWWSVRKAS